MDQQQGSGQRPDGSVLVLRVPRAGDAEELCDLLRGRFTKVDIRTAQGDDVYLVIIDVPGWHADDLWREITNSPAQTRGLSRWTPVNGHSHGVSSRHEF